MVSQTAPPPSTVREGALSEGLVARSALPLPSLGSFAALFNFLSHQSLRELLSDLACAPFHLFSALSLGVKGIFMHQHCHAPVTCQLTA